ncbi:MAG: oligosaccharide flippase family protein [Solirubrobacterales bacterium]
MTELQFPDADPTPDEVAVEAQPYQGRFGAIRSLRQHAARGMIVNSIYQIGLAGLALVRGLGAAAFLTTSEYGIWGLLGLSIFTVIAMKSIGVNQKYVQQSEDDQELAFQRGFTIELIFSSISLPTVAAVVCGVALVTGHSELIVPGLILTLLVPGLALQFPLMAYYRRMDFRRQRTLQAVDPVVATVVTILLAALDFGYWALVVGAVTGALVGGIVAIFNSPYPLRVRYDHGTLRRYISFSGPMAVAGVAVLFSFYAIFLTGNVAIGLVGLGAFTMVGNLVRFTDKADAVIMETLYPAICAVQDRVATLYDAFTKSNRLALMWAAPFGIGVSLFASDLVHFVIGDQWTEAIPLLEVIGVITAVHHVGFNWSAFYLARGETKPIAVAAVLGGAATVAAGVPLMFAAGISGLAWGYAFGEIVALANRGRYITRLFPDFKPLRHLMRAFWPTAIAAGAVLVVDAVAEPGDTAAAAALELGMFLAIVAVATWSFERALLREAFGYFSRRSDTSGPEEASAPAV